MHLFAPHDTVHAGADLQSDDPAHLEEEKVAGAIKTDFILSAEIMAIALAAMDQGSIWMVAATLAVVAIGITAMVYGSVAVIVKADDVGLHMATHGRLSLTKAIGRGIVKGMPGFLKLLMVVGTAAMLWVGGSIVIHGLDSLEFSWLEHHIYDWATQVSHLVSQQAEATVKWFAKAAMDGVVGLAIGLVIIPVVKFVSTMRKQL